MVLKYHNTQRRRVANGREQGKSGNLPKGNKINELSWDCNLEAIAHDKLTKCTSINKLGAYGFNDGTKKEKRESHRLSKKAKCSLEQDTKTLMKTWWDEVRKTDWPANQEYSKKFRHFAPMVYDKSKGVGCTYTLCNDEVKMVCAYNEDIVGKNPAEKMYEKAAADTCGGCTKDTCFSGLCVEKYTPVEAPTACKDDGMTDELANTAEGLLANGWAKNKLSNTGYAPIAAKMLAVKYECKNYGKEAYEKIKDCTKNIQAPTAGKVMSSVEIGDLNLSNQEALEKAITDWWGQLETKGLPENLEYTADIESANKITEFVRDFAMEKKVSEYNVYFSTQFFPLLSYLGLNDPDAVLCEEFTSKC
ncbi:SCP-like protein [Ancylostoma duodenale]|uniref:SCP-like protein n=1 Tax=Ancylostoma duodenale TaxID=51022 RepID=A0A0C2DE55_9BILA|nr:SCP-like protein [Ancylostoma duodenale]